MKLFVYAPLLIVAGAISLFVASSCDAELESTCKDGDCGQGLTDNVCDPTCDIDKTHGFPCDVYKIVSGVCQDCHIPGGIGPFQLLSWGDTQCGYPDPQDKTSPIWADMQLHVQLDAPAPQMPQNAFPLPNDCLDTLNAWFKTCAAAGGCKKGEGNDESGADPDISACDAALMGGGGAGMGGLGGTGGAGGGTGGTGGAGGTGG